MRPHASTVRLTACLAAVLTGLVGVRGSAAAITAGTTIDANTFIVDRLANYFSVAPGGDAVATGDVDTLAVAFGSVPSARTFTDVFTVTNASSATQTATLTLTGAPQIAAVTFNASGSSSVVLAPGASTAVSMRTSTTAGRGAGTLELRLGGSSWLYREYPVAIDLAPEAPSAVTATARAAGRIALAWDASTTTNVSGYDVYRAAGADSLMKLATTSSTAFDDTATVDGTAYRYVVRAVSSGAPSFDSAPTPQAEATADAAAPAQPSSVAADAYVNAASVAAFQTSVTLPAGSASTDTVTVTLTGGAVAVTASVAATAGAGTVTLAVDARSLPEGAVLVQATVRDAAGNVSSAATRSATKDTVAPGAPSAVYVDNKNVADEITGLTEGGGAITAAQTAPGTSGPYTTTASGSGAYTVAVAPAKRETVTYAVAATDAAGNTGPATTISFATVR